MDPELRFCPACGGPLKPARPPGDERERLVCQRCRRVQYENPKIVVGSVVEWRGRFLLCRRAIEPRAGFWTLPAGFLEMGESPEEGALREAFEEARARIRIEGLLAVFHVRRIGQVQLIYRARLETPEIAPGPESREVGLFAPADLPRSEIAFPTVHWALDRAIELAGREGPLVPVGNPEGSDPEPPGAPPSS